MGPLKQLSLAGIKLDHAHTHSLVLLHNQLECLNLADTAVDAAALLEVASAPWPHLQGLVLEGNKLKASAIGSLALVQMPSLYDLHLADHQVDFVAAKYLAEGAWSRLGYLGLHGNLLDDLAMVCLADGCWPRLCVMTLYGNDFGVRGIQLLMEAQWPLLSMLTLDNNLCCKATCKLLKLVGRKKSGFIGGLSWSYISRDVSGLSGQRVWPILKSVQFMQGGPL